MNEPLEITDAPKIVVAIDGYSSSGKSTMARELAKRVVMFMWIRVLCIVQSHFSL